MRKELAAAINALYLIAGGCADEIEGSVEGIVGDGLLALMRDGVTPEELTDGTYSGIFDREPLQAMLDADEAEFDRLATLCSDAGVTIVEAQEEEIRGMWDWLDADGNACDHSFDTEREAMEDAVRHLNLK